MSDSTVKMTVSVVVVEVIEFEIDEREEKQMTRVREG